MINKQRKRFYIKRLQLGANVAVATLGNTIDLSAVVALSARAVKVSRIHISAVLSRGKTLQHHRLLCNLKQSRNKERERIT